MSAGQQLASAPSAHEAVSDIVAVLLVEDEPAIRAILAEGLEIHGYDVVQAANGEEALRRVAERPDIRVVVSDIRMPGMSGIELLDRLAGLDAANGMRTILMSGYFSGDAVTRPILRKPFSIDDLATAIRRELGC